MYISLRESRANGFMKWFDAYQLLSTTKDDDGDVAIGDAIAIAGLNSDYAVMTLPELPHGPWLVPGVDKCL
jgi:hypothetical protein